MWNVHRSRVRLLVWASLEIVIFCLNTSIRSVAETVPVLKHLALDITANCICEIYCKALDGLDLETVHKLCREKRKNLSKVGIQAWGCWVGNYAAPLPLADTVPVFGA